MIDRGFGEIVDTPAELWHGDAWMKSVRSTSGNFAWAEEIVQGVPTQVVLLPLDCVNFINSSGELAFGRVKAIGLDKRNPQPGNGGVLSANINGLVLRLQLPGHIENVLQQPPLVSPETETDVYVPYPSSLPEFVLCDSRDIVPISAIRKPIWVNFTDYESPQSLLASLLPHTPTFCVRHIIYMLGGHFRVRPVSERHRVTAETELITLTRDTVLTLFVSNTSNSNQG